MIRCHHFQEMLLENSHSAKQWGCIFEVRFQVGRPLFPPNGCFSHRKQHGRELRYNQGQQMVLYEHRDPDEMRFTGGHGVVP